MSRVLYVIECAHNRAYVGSTCKDPYVRFEEHAAGDGAEWTKEFQPLRLSHVTRVQGNEAKSQEDTLTKRLMSERGINAVRGGSYVNLELTEEQICALERELAHQRNACLECGGNDHFARQCPNVSTGRARGGSMFSERSRWQDQRAQAHSTHGAKRPVCGRCGWPGHTIYGCYARRDVKGRHLPDEGNKECFRCGRTGHFVRDCFATRHVDGTPLD